MILQESLGHPCPVKTRNLPLLFLLTGYLFLSLLAPNFATNSSLRKHYSPAMGGELLFGGKTTGLKNLLTVFDSGSSYTYFNSKAYQAVTYLVRNS